MEKLTLKQLKEMKPHTIFAKGEIIDSPEGCNMANTKKIIRWVAVRGGIYDWCIYVQNPYYIDDGVWDWERIKSNGDKVGGEANIKKLVPCDEEAFKMYRY